MTVRPEIEELADTIERRMAGRSGALVVRPHVSFARLVAPPRRLLVESRAGIALLAQGAKRLHVGERSYESAGCEYLLSTASARGEVEILESQAKKPLLGITVDFEQRRLARVMLDMEIDRDSGPPPRQAWLSGELDRSLARAFLNVAHLACSDSAWRVLGEGALRELYYWALRGEPGRALRSRMVFGANVDAVRRAAHFIETHLSEPLDVARIARAAAMSPSGLYAHFGELLRESPMQFVKRLRLESAKSRIAAGEGVTRAALEVGYASPSQFSRDFQRHFGVAPSRLKSARRTFKRPPADSPYGRPSSPHDASAPSTADTRATARSRRLGASAPRR